MDMFENNKERIVTGFALLFGALILGVIDSFFLMWLTFGVVYLIAFKEASLLFNVQKDGLLLYGAALWILAGIYPKADDLFLLAALAYAGAIAFNKELAWEEFFPFIYPTAGMLFMLSLYDSYGVLSLLWLLGVVALTDVGAYVVGKSIGKTPFCQTSPNKTMEGVVGGVAIATVGGMMLGLLVVEAEHAFFVSFVVAISSIFGDLFESSLKRKAGVKDSGDILPGHGGILDRIDGYLFGGIVMLILLRGLL